MPAQSPTFENLFDQHMGRLWALSLRLCGNREDAEDLLQEAAIIGFRSFGKFEVGTNFAAWMSMIVINAHRNSVRARNHRATTVSLDGLNMDSDVGDNFLYEQLRAQGKGARRGEPEARFFDALDSGVISQAFHTFPPEFRECCSLFWVAELPYEDIARVLGVPLGTVRSRLHRGRKLLQSALWTLAVERGLVREKSRPAGTSPPQSNLLSLLLLLGALAGRIFR